MINDHINGNFKCSRAKCKKENSSGNHLEFETKAEYEGHKLGHEILDSYTCELCGEEFSGNGRSTAYSRHIELHSMTEEKFKCNECDNKFFFEKDLSNHWNAIHGEKKYLCTVCDFMTRDRRHLNGHMIVHSQERNFLCTICLQAFKTNYYLRNHMTKHSDIRSHRCEFCDKCFKQRKNLTEHKKIHTGQFSAFCKICDKGFVQKYNLKLHNDKHHPEQSNEIFSEKK